MTASAFTRVPTWARLAAAAVALCAAAACASGPIGHPATLTRQINDNAATNAMRARMMRSDYDFRGVELNVVNGLVLMKGVVADPPTRIEAERIAWTAPNVRDVANELSLAGEVDRGVGLDDQRISATVRARLIAGRHTQNATINVETYDGVVYLLGRAPSAAQARRAAESASVVSGVRRVVTYIEPRLEGAPALDPGGTELLGGPNPEES